MSLAEILKKRRSYYNINRELPVSEEKVLDIIKEVADATPDAFNMQSARLVVVLGEKQDKMWDKIYDTFDGRVAREKIDAFKAGYGTILFFIEEDTVRSLQEQFASYAHHFPTWANQSNGMLQSNLWVGLREVGIGASLQHYNPVIDSAVTELLDLPESWKLIAQMPFGGILSEPDTKERAPIETRVIIKK